MTWVSLDLAGRYPEQPWRPGHPRYRCLEVVNYAAPSESSLLPDHALLSSPAVPESRSLWSETVFQLFGRRPQQEQAQVGRSRRRLLRTPCPATHVGGPPSLYRPRSETVQDRFGVTPDPAEPSGYRRLRFFSGARLPVPRL